MKIRNITLIIFLIFISFENIANAEKHNLELNSFDINSFQKDLYEIPANYFGHDPYQIFKALLKVPVKGEYETSLKFSERLNLWERSPLYGNLMIDGLMAIKANFFLLSSFYDADTETLTFYFNENLVSAEDFRTPYILIKSNNKKLKTRIGQTGMGVKFEYQREVIEEFGLKIDNFNILVSQQKFEIKIDPESAKNRQKWKVFFIGKLTKPYLFRETSFHAATLTEQFEQKKISEGLVLSIGEMIIFMDSVSPKIISRVPMKYIPYQ